MSPQFKREQFLEHFANRQKCLIGMEACGGAQHWARKLTAMGHQVKLLPVKAAVRKGISDALGRLAHRLTVFQRWSSPARAIGTHREGG